MDPARRPFKAIAFDVDGTLYADLQMYLHTMGWSLRNLHLIRMSLLLKQVRETLRKDAPVADFYFRQASLVAAEMGEDAKRIKEIIDQGIYGEWELKLKGLKLAPGLERCLDDLKSAGYKMGVLSDFPVSRKLEVLGVGHWFDKAVCTEELGCLKPHPAGFLRLAEELGESPTDILFVGNSYSYDVLGAAATGMRTAHFARRAPAGSIADLTFHNYEILRDWIRGNN